MSVPQLAHPALEQIRRNSTHRRGLACNLLRNLRRCRLAAAAAAAAAAARPAGIPAGREQRAGGKPVRVSIHSCARHQRGGADGQRHLALAAGTLGRPGNISIYSYIYIYIYRATCLSFSSWLCTAPARACWREVSLSQLVLLDAQVHIYIYIYICMYVYIYISIYRATCLSFSSRPCAAPARACWRAMASRSCSRCSWPPSCGYIYICTYLFLAG